MAKRKILPGIYAVYDEEGVEFHCDDELIEDLEFTWEDLEDSELVAQTAEELAEYLDGEDAHSIENPVSQAQRQLKKLRNEIVASLDDDFDDSGDFVPDLDDDDDDDEDDE